MKLQEKFQKGSTVAKLHEDYNKYLDKPGEEFGVFYTDQQHQKVEIRDPDATGRVQSSMQLYILDKKDGVIPMANKSMIRLFGHYMCPFVEKARMVFAAKKIDYQPCLVNLEKRAKWHYELNDGYVPFI